MRRDSWQAGGTTRHVVYDIGRSSAATPASVAGRPPSTRPVVDERTLELVERRRSGLSHSRGWLVRRSLLVADTVGLMLAFVTAELLFGPPFAGGAHDRIDPLIELFVFVATLPGWLVVAKLYRLYDRDEERADHTTSDDLVGVFHMVTVGVWFFFAASWFTDLVNPSFLKLFAFWGLAIVLIPVSRLAARSMYRRNVGYLQNTVIVGAGDIGQLVARKILKHPEYGINLVGFIDSSPKARREDLDYLVLLGDLGDLPELISLLDIERIVVAFSGDSHEQSLELIRSLAGSGVQIDVVPRLFEVLGPGAGIHSVEGLPLVSLPVPRLTRSSRLAKRTLDVSLGLAALVLLAPAFALIALWIKLDSRGPVFFRQLRMGGDDRTFAIYKFRTMSIDADERKLEFAHLNAHAQRGGDPHMFKIPEDPRATRVGRFLRHYSLDELPQLLNVVKGEMSLVGPRPLILAEDAYIDGWGRRRLDLRPGMTGLWQVLGRNEIPFAEMVRLDYLYVTTWSLWGDLRLLLRTIPLVCKGARAPY